MKVVLLCGGEGIRLKEDQDFRPKALIPVEGKPIIYNIMKHFSFYGLIDFILCVDSKGKHIESYLKSQDLSEEEKENISRWNIKILDTGESKTGARVFKTKDLIGDKDFIVSYSDVIADINISKLLIAHRTMDKILTMTGVHPTTPLGIITQEDGLVTKFDVEAKSASTIKGGYFVCKPAIFNYLSDDPGCTFETEPLSKLIEEKQVALYDHDGFWKHFDSYKDINELIRLSKEENPSWKIQ